MSRPATRPTDPPHLTALLGNGRGTVGQILRARAEQTPDGRMLLWEGHAWTYAQGVEEIDRVSGWALANGAPARIASFLPNCPEAVWAWFGSLMSGAVYVPLNRAHRGPILEDMIRRSGAEVLVTDRAGLDLLPDLVETALTTLLVIDDDGSQQQLPGLTTQTWEHIKAATPARNCNEDPAAIAELMYTSGTTGRSKAVAIPHNELVRGGAWVAWSLDLTESDVIHGWLPLFHIGGQLDQAMAFLIAGATMALQPTFSRTRFWQQVQDAGATVFIGFSNVLEIVWSIDAADADQACTLRAGIMGGIPPKLHRAFEERFAVKLHDIYGMTEAEPLVLPYPGTTPPPGSAGFPAPDFDLTIVDDTGSPVPTGATGHVQIRPRVPDVMLGTYEGDETALTDAMRDGWFRTGDLGRFDEDGYFFFLDRAKHAIRRRGENISSFELERIIIEHEAVEECCAIGVPSPLGEEDVKIVVVPAHGAQIDAPALRDWCTAQMAAFMVPRYIHVRPELPRGPTGKVQKEELARHAEATFDAEAHAASPHA